MESARVAVDHAPLQVAQKAVRDAQVKIHYALHYARSADVAAGPPPLGGENLPPYAPPPSALVW